MPNQEPLHFLFFKLICSWPFVNTLYPISMNAKKLFLLPLLVLTLGLTSCVEEDKAANDDDQIPTDIEQKGVLGSWSHIYENQDQFPSIGREWIIQRNRVSIYNVCNLGAGRISAKVEVNAEVRGGTVTLLESATRTISENGLNCSITVSANTIYGLNLISENVLRITEGGESLQYTRFTD